MLVQKYYFDAEYSAVRNDREISINSFRKKEFLFVTRLLYKTIVMHCKITQGLCDPFCVASWYSKMFLHILHEHIIMKHENICREFYHGGCFHSLIIKSYSGLVSYCQNSDIRELNVLLVHINDKIHETFPEINSLAILWISNLKIFSLYI